MTKIVKISLIATVSLLFTACTSSAPIVESPNYKLGSQDGCATAKGAYTKNSVSFNSDKEYKDGWFSGRRNCNPSQSK